MPTIKPFEEGDERLGIHHIGKTFAVFITVTVSLRFVTNAFPRGIYWGTGLAFALSTFFADPRDRGGSFTQTSPALLDNMKRAEAANHIYGGADKVMR